MQQDNVKKKFEELLGKRSPAFLSSVLQVVSSNDLLLKARPETIYSAAVMAATLDLPINNNFGFAYIVPYKDAAQFQIGYKGLIQLAQRSGLYKSIDSRPVYEGQIEETDDSFSGFQFRWSQKKSDKVIGYAARIELLNGFEKVLYMTVADLQKHGQAYSQTFRKGFGLWKDNFDAMAQKTVLKLLISKFGPMSVELQRATIADQSVIRDADTLDVQYVDNEPQTLAVTNAIDTREEEVLKAALVEIEKADTLEKLEAVKAKMGSEILIQLEPQIEAHANFIVKANEQA